MIQVFWDVTVNCSFILFPTFRNVPPGRTSGLLKMQPVRFLEKSGIYNPAPRCNNPEEIHRASKFIVPAGTLRLP
jgi:hypothetical protein